MSDVQVWQLIAGALFVQTLLQDFLFRRSQRRWTALLQEVARGLIDLARPTISPTAEITVQGLPHPGPSQVFNRPHDITERA